jgi:hypothetical protein
MGQAFFTPNFCQLFEKLITDLSTRNFYLKKQALMQFHHLMRAYFVKRDNRFRATVSLLGQEVTVHLPNSGRLADLLIPHRPLWLAAGRSILDRQPS